MANMHLNHSYLFSNQNGKRLKCVWCQLNDDAYKFAIANRFVIKTQYDLSVFDVNSKVKPLTLSVCMYLFHQIKEIKKQKLS